MQAAAEAVIIPLKTIVKAHRDGARRLVEVQASAEVRDAEGDVITQQALIDAAPLFIKNGTLDINHLSELGHRMGLPNPDSYIVGKPIEVKDIGRKRTSVVGEIMRSKDGTVDAKKNQFDMLWETLEAQPPVAWKSSIYGFPRSDAIVDCRGQMCESGATRFHINALEWKSLAFTRNPVCDAIDEPARIITAKAMMAALMKAVPWMPDTIRAAIDSEGSEAATGLGFFPSDKDSMAPPDIGGPAPNAGNTYPPAFSLACSAPRDLSDAVGQWHQHIKRDCMQSGGQKSTLGFKAHFEKCCGMEPPMAELYSHALMHALLLDKRRV